MEPPAKTARGLHSVSRVGCTQQATLSPESSRPSLEYQGLGQAGEANPKATMIAPEG